MSSRRATISAFCPLNVANAILSVLLASNVDTSSVKATALFSSSPSQSDPWSKNHVSFMTVSSALFLPCVAMSQCLYLHVQRYRESILEIWINGDSMSAILKKIDHPDFLIACSSLIILIQPISSVQISRPCLGIATD
jgi:hypothetical protein